MKSELKAKFVQHLISKKKGNEGFTLIELLVVIIIIGILAAIALPSFLNQANKARESEGKNFTGTLLRAQQANYLETQKFTTNLTADLETGESKADFYKFCAAVSGTEGQNGYKVVVTADPKNDQLKGFEGATSLVVTATEVVFDTSGPTDQTAAAVECKAAAAP